MVFIMRQQFQALVAITKITIQHTHIKTYIYYVYIYVCVYIKIKQTITDVANTL